MPARKSGSMKTLSEKSEKAIRRRTALFLRVPKEKIEVLKLEIVPGKPVVLIKIHEGGRT